MQHVYFLPGASGQLHFWRPLIECMGLGSTHQIIAYPGFGGVAEEPEIQNFQHLQSYVLSKIQKPTVIVAQSMGGIFAIAKALEQPEFVQALVLIATSGGLDLSQFVVQDWREEYQQHYPDYPAWFTSAKVDYADQLHQLKCPILLIWGDNDPISPIEVGQYLHDHLPCSVFKVIQGGQHDLAHQYADLVSEYIHVFFKENHLLP